VVVRPELTGSPIDALASTGIRPRPAQWGSPWGSENARVDSNPIATLRLGAATAVLISTYYNTRICRPDRTDNPALAGTPERRPASRACLRLDTNRGDGGSALEAVTEFDVCDLCMPSGLNPSRSWVPMGRSSRCPLGVAPTSCASRTLEVGAAL
jgi:hypothetical protein